MPVNNVELQRLMAVCALHPVATNRLQGIYGYGSAVRIIKWMAP